MNGEIMQFRFYKSSSHSKLTIPLPFTERLEWKNKDTIHIRIRCMEGSPALFLYKDKGEGITNYKYDDETSESRVTIPKSIALSLDWRDKDTIYIEPKKIERVKGLVLQKIEKQ
jgi:bifunctional DNA-binding transcriptional regulator/antitoxin component of YhaV-PrlF toxin-antitoxin module